jgi:anti-sigma factor RsiW
VTCPHAAADLGAYVLGALDPEERRRVEEHVAVCPVCAAELAEFRSLPALLDRVRPEDLRPVTVEPSPDLFARVSAAAGVTGRRRVRLSRVRGPRTRGARTRGPRARGPRTGRSRARIWALAAAAVLAVLGAGVGVVVWGSDAADQSSTASAGPVHATVTAIPAQEGLALDVTVAGLRPGETCRLVAVDRDGGRHPAGEWPVSGEGDGRWRGWADLDRGALTAVVLLGDGGRELVRVPF